MKAEQQQKQKKNTKSNAEIGKEKREFLPSVNCIRHMYNKKIQK